VLGHAVQFAYTCWDRIVLHGYLERLQRPAGLVWSFHDPKKLDFRPMPTSAPAPEATAPSVSPPQSSVAATAEQQPMPVKMTIADAKRALAATFGVDPDAIEITIRG
jgi:hypothetical protein